MAWVRLFTYISTWNMLDPANRCVLVNLYLPPMHKRREIHSESHWDRTPALGVASERFIHCAMAFQSALVSHS